LLFLLPLWEDEEKEREEAGEGEEEEERAKFSFLLINPNTLWYRPWCERDEVGAMGRRG